jgi:hypothetical protein
LSFLAILNGTLFVCLCGFNAWNWFLALNGITTIEFWKRASQGNDADEMYDYRFEHMSDNLFTIFGTQKLIRILSPSLRNLPFNGIEFSFLLKDRGYDEYGWKLL